MGSYTRIFSKYNSNNSGYINWSKKSIILAITKPIIKFLGKIKILKIQKKH